MDDASNGSNHGAHADEETEAAEGLHRDPLAREALDAALGDVQLNGQEHCEGPEAKRPHDACSHPCIAHETSLHPSLRMHSSLRIDCLNHHDKPMPMHRMGPYAHQATDASQGLLVARTVRNPVVVMWLHHLPDCVCDSGK